MNADLNLEDKDFKNTVKLTWLAETPKAAFTPTYCVYYDHIISKAVLAKDEDFKNFIGKDTRVSITPKHYVILKSVVTTDGPRTIPVSVYPI